MRNKEHHPQLWPQRHAEKRRGVDIISPMYSGIHEALLKSKKYGQANVRQDGIYSDVVEYRFKQRHDDGKLTPRVVYVDAHIGKDDSIRVSVAEGFDQQKKPIGLRGFYVLKSGDIIDADDQRVLDPVTDKLDMDIIENGLIVIENHEKKQVRDYLERRAEIRGNVRNAAIGAFALGALTAGVYGGLRAWVYEPAEQLQEYREEFDQTEQLLPSEGIPFDYYRFETLPPEDFDVIPGYGGDDRDLSSPRTIWLNTSTGCAAVSSEVPSSGELFVALPEDSPYIGYNFETSIEETGFSVCITDDNPLDAEAEDFEIAVQVR